MGFEPRTFFGRSFTKNLIDLLGLQSIKNSQDEAERMESVKHELPMLEKLLKIGN
ncbi:hypothetical protein ACFLRN_10835 [Thermoproteota archaeon]